MKKYLSAAYILFLIVFLAGFLWNSYREILTALESTSLTAIGLALACCLAAVLSQAYTWKTIQCTISQAPDLKIHQWIRIFMFGYMGRYIPGKVGLVVGRVISLEPYKLSKTSVIQASLLEIFFTLLSGIILGLFVCYQSLTELFPQLLLPLFIAMVLGLIAMAIFFFTSLAERGIDYALAKINKAPWPHLSTKNKLTFTLRSMLLHVFMGLGFSILVLAHAPDLNVQSVIQLISVHAFAVCGGILSIIAPGGLGVREGFIILMAPSQIPHHVIVTMTLLMRFVTLFAEAIIVIAFSKIRQSSRD